MENKPASLSLLLLLIGIVIMLISLIPYPVKKIEAYDIPYSKVCYDHYQSSISADSSKSITVEGPDLQATVPEGLVLNISLQVQSSVDLHVEGKKASIVYVPIQRAIHVHDDLWAPQVQFTSDWLTRESHVNVSSLNVNHVVSGGYWLYRLRFENDDPQPKTIDLSVIEHWTEIAFKDTTINYYLVPSWFTYIGAAFAVTWVFVFAWGLTTKRFARSDVRDLLQNVSNDISYHMEGRKVVLTTMLTLALLFLSFFAHSRLGVGEAVVNEKLRTTFVLYHGFPLEIVGFITPLTMEDLDLVFEPLIEAHSPARAYSPHFAYNEPFEGYLVIVWDGLLVNFAFYLAMSFALVLALSFLAEKFHCLRSPTQ